MARTIDEELNAAIDAVMKAEAALARIRGQTTPDEVALRHAVEGGGHSLRAVRTQLMLVRRPAERGTGL